MSTREDRPVCESAHPPAKNTLLPNTAAVIPLRGWLNSAVDQELLVTSKMSTLDVYVPSPLDPPANTILLPTPTAVLYPTMGRVLIGINCTLTLSLIHISEPTRLLSI